MIRSVPKINLIVLFAVHFLCTEVLAGRNEGINVQYECLGANEYEITVHLFRDCAEFTETPDFLDVYIASSCQVIGFVEMDFDESLEVSQLCPDSLPSSSCNGGNLPGVNLTVYRGVVNLPPCSDWEIVVAEQNRAEVENLVDPFGDSRLHVEAFLNNSAGDCNTSPQLGLRNLPFVCVDNEFFYNLSFSDPDGDSLAYDLVPALTSTQADMPYEMTYEAGYDPQNPIDNIEFDPNTGQMNLTPDQEGKYTVVVEAREYRDGELIGRVYFDFNVIVIPCAVPPPTPIPGSLSHVSGGGYPISENTIGICQGDDFCFELDFGSTDPSVALTLSSDIQELLPGATQIQSGINPATIQFCGTVPSDFDGGTFVVSAIDDFCSIYGQAYYAIAFEIREPLMASVDTTICAGEPFELEAINDTIYNWYDSDGNLISPGPNFSCNPCSNPIATVDTSTVFIVEGAYDQGSCANRDTVFISVPLSIEAEVVAETCLEDDGVIEIGVLTGSGNYEVVWDDDPTNALVRTDLDAGSYSVSITDQTYGCSETFAFEVDNLIFPEANAGENGFSCGLSYQAEAIPSFGAQSWESLQAGVSFSNANSIDPNITVPAAGQYQFVWTEDDGNACFDTDTLVIDFYEMPIADLTTPDTVCGSTAPVEALIENGVSNWEFDSAYDLESLGGENWAFVSSTESTTELILEVENGPCLAADTIEVTFLDQPEAFAGDDQTICGAEVLLEASPSVGAGIWDLPEELTPEGPFTQAALSAATNSFGEFEAIWEESNQSFCIDRDTVRITFIPNPSVPSLSDTVVCGNELELVSGIVADQVEWNSFGLDIQNGGTTTPLFSGDFGIHEISVLAVNQDVCAEADSLTVVFLEQPSIAPQMIDTICGMEAEVEAPSQGFDVEWLSDDLDVAELTPSAYLLESAEEGSFQATLILGNQATCYDSTLYELTFYDAPDIQISSSTEICGLSTSVSAVLQTNGDLSWGLSGPSDGEFGNQEEVTELFVSDFGSYQIFATETNGTCVSTDTIEVDFQPEPEILELEWDCTGIDAESQFHFQAGGDAGGGFDVQGWNLEITDSGFVSEPIPNGTQVEILLSNGTVCPTDTLGGSVECPIITQAGQMQADTIFVCGNDTAEALSLNPPVQDGNDTLLYALHDAPGEELGQVYQWANQPEFFYQESLSLNEVYYISSVVGNSDETGIDLNHPQISVGIGQPVVFESVPSAHIDFSQIVCPSDTVFIPVSFSGNLPQSFTYFFASEEFTLQVDDSDLEIMVTDSGSVVPISTASEHCSGEVFGSASIQYFEEPSLSFEAQADFCEGDSAIIDMNFQGQGPFSFDLSSGNSDSGFFSETDTAIYVQSEGIFEISSFSDQLCVLDTTYVFEVVQHSLPEVNAGPDLLACAGDSLILGGSISSGVDYSWGSNQGILEETNPQSVFYAVNNGTFAEIQELILVGQNEHCQARDSVLITIYPIPELGIAKPETICQNDSVFIHGYGAETYSWEPASLFSVSDSSSGLFHGNIGLQEIVLTGSNEAGCEVSITEMIEVSPLPSADLQLSALEGCAPLQVEITAVEDEEDSVYQWSLNGNEISEGASTELFLDQGVHLVSLRSISSEGCESHLSHPDTIRVYDITPEYSFSPENPSITDPEVRFYDYSAGAAMSVWTIDTLSIIHGSSVNFEFPPDMGGAYNIELLTISEEGCSDSIRFTVNVRDDFLVFVPNAFTPDGDGINDLFGPVLSRIDAIDYRFWITNRRGEVVFETSDPLKKWNGTENGTEFYGRTGIYQWHLQAKPDFNLETRFYHGLVTLIR